MPVHSTNLSGPSLRRRYTPGVNKRPLLALLTALFCACSQPQSAPAAGGTPSPAPSPAPSQPTDVRLQVYIKLSNMSSQAIVPNGCTLDLTSDRGVDYHTSWDCTSDPLLYDDSVEDGDVMHLSYHYGRSFSRTVVQVCADGLVLGRSEVSGSQGTGGDSITFTVHGKDSRPAGAPRVACQPL